MESGGSHLARLTSQQAPGIPLFLTSQCEDCKSVPLSLGFSWVWRLDLGPYPVLN